MRFACKLCCDLEILSPFTSTHTCTGLLFHLRATSTPSEDAKPRTYPMEDRKKVFAYFGTCSRAILSMFEWPGQSLVWLKDAEGKLQQASQVPSSIINSLQELMGLP